MAAYIDVLSLDPTKPILVVLQQIAYNPDEIKAAVFEINGRLPETLSGSLPYIQS